MSEKWASLEGWVPDPDRPGFLKDPTRPGWARTPAGEWRSQQALDADIIRARAAVEDAARQLQPAERIDLDPATRQS